MRYGKDVVKYYKMTHPNAQFLSNVFIDPLYYDPDTKGVTEAGKQRYADAWTNYTSETPGGFSVFAEATDPGYQQFLQIRLLQEKTAGGMTAMGRGFVRPMEKLGGMLDTAFCGIGRLGQDIVYELGSPFVESLFGYDAANAFYDGIYGTQEEQKRQQELQAATGTDRDMLYNNAVTQYPVYTKGGEVAGQVVLIAASTVTLNGLGLTTAVESGIAPYVTEMGKTVLSMTATETLAETIVLISPNMDYNIKHGMSWNRALNVAAAEEVECLIMNLAGNFLGYGIDNVLTGEKRVVMLGDDSGGVANVDYEYRIINPEEIRFSQSSVNDVNVIAQSMIDDGWRGEPINVVLMPDNMLTTMDNTRVAAARIAGIDVRANVHLYGEELPEVFVSRFSTKKGTPLTWGSAAELRIMKQKSSFRSMSPYGKLNIDDIK